MPTPLYVCDDEFRSVTILPQDPERAVHVLKGLIKDGIIIPKNFEKAYFEFPYEVAPLEIVCSDSNVKYNKVYVLAGFICKHTYVTFLDKIGADVLHNYRFTCEILDLFGFKYDSYVKNILKNEAELCNENGTYSAKLVSGKHFSYIKNGRETRYNLTQCKNGTLQERDGSKLTFDRLGTGLYTKDLSLIYQMQVQNRPQSCTKVP